MKFHVWHHHHQLLQFSQSSDPIAQFVENRLIQTELSIIFASIETLRPQGNGLKKYRKGCLENLSDSHTWLVGTFLQKTSRIDSGHTGFTWGEQHKTLGSLIGQPIGRQFIILWAIEAGKWLFEPILSHAVFDSSRGSYVVQNLSHSFCVSSTGWTVDDPMVLLGHSDLWITF